MFSRGRSTNLIWYKQTESYLFEKSLPNFSKRLFYLISGLLLGQGVTFVRANRGGKYAFRFRKVSLLLVLYIANLFKEAGYAEGFVNQPKGIKHFEFVSYHTDLFTYI